jgi:nucleoside-diphosphate-sugar epimerase
LVNVLVTGASGFIGKVLIDRLLNQGHTVFGLYRNNLPEPREGLVVLTGDILEEHLGQTTIYSKIDRLYHLAGIVNLGTDRDGMTYKTNVEGTRNVLGFCIKYEIPHILFCSTAYNQGRNVYERSKALAEMIVRESDIPQKTIFKPSIVLGTPEYPYGGHFSQFTSTIIRVHQRAERVRRAVEGTLRLPPLRPALRIKGNPDGYLNLVRVNKVVARMAEITAPGTYWLTNKNPPKLSELAEWSSETMMVDIKIEREFKPSPIEYQLGRLLSAFSPYLQGDDFPSDIADGELDADFIKWTINARLR